VGERENRECRKWTDRENERIYNLGSDQGERRSVREWLWSKIRDKERGKVNKDKERRTENSVEINRLRNRGFMEEEKERNRRRNI